MAHDDDGDDYANDLSDVSKAQEICFLAHGNCNPGTKWKLNDDNTHTRCCVFRVLDGTYIFNLLLLLMMLRRPFVVVGRVGRVGLFPHTFSSNTIASCVLGLAFAWRKHGVI